MSKVQKPERSYSIPSKPLWNLQWQARAVDGFIGDLVSPHLRDQLSWAQLSPCSPTSARQRAESRF